MEKKRVMYLTCDGQASLCLGLCSALVLWDGFAFALWHLDSCLFGVKTRMDGDTTLVQ